MKILILLRKWPGGVGVVVENLKREFEKKGHQVKCISREDDLNIYSTFSSIGKIRSIVENESFDIVYTQDWNMALPLLAPYPIYSKKHFCCFHGNQTGRSRIVQTIIGKILGSHLIVVGDTLKKRFPRSNLVYNGVDTDRFKPYKKDNKRKYVGWIDKGTETITREELEKICRKLGMKLRTAGKPHVKDMNEFYNSCEIFISLPPESAGFNMCWIEAMASGVPKIIGNDEGIGSKLNIDKIDRLDELKNKMINSRDNDYVNMLQKEKYSWEGHVSKLIGLFGR